MYAGYDEDGGYDGMMGFGKSDGYDGSDECMMCMMCMM